MTGKKYSELLDPWNAPNWVSISFLQGCSRPIEGELAQLNEI